MAIYAISSRPRRRYVGNAKKAEAHDLKRESLKCQVDEIVAAGDAVAFYPDSLVQAHADEYDSCAWCLGSVRRGPSNESKAQAR